MTQKGHVMSLPSYPSLLALHRVSWAIAPGQSLRHPHCPTPLSPSRPGDGDLVFREAQGPGPAAGGLGLSHLQVPTHRHQPGPPPTARWVLEDKSGQQQVVVLGPPPWGLADLQQDRGHSDPPAPGSFLLRRARCCRQLEGRPAWRTVLPAQGVGSF